MRILHIVRQFSPAIGGLENFVFCLARAQLQAGVHAQVLTLNSVFHQEGPPLPAQDVIDGIPVTRIAWRGSYKYPLALPPLELLRSVDLIHVHAVDFFADYLPLIRAWHKKPMILSTHGGYFHTGYASRLKRVFFQTVTRFSVRGYARVVACSEGDHSLFSRLCGPWLQLIENGVDIEKYRQLGAPEFRPHCLFIGRFSDNKRLDLLLETFHRLVQRAPDARLTVIGRDWDGNLARMNTAIDTLGLTARVEIATGLSDEQIKEKITRHCMVISASDYEGFGMTLVEGMAAGLIPVASPITSFRRIVETAGIGLQVDFHQPETAAAQIHDYFRDIAPQFSALRAAAIHASERYGWSGTAARFQQTYEEVLGSRTRTIQGVAIDTRSGQEIIREIERRIEQRQPLRIAIANAHTINLARHHPHYRTLLENFLVLNDGVGVNLASRWKYRQAFSENLNGTDFVPRLLAESRRSLRVFLVGARPDVVRAAQQRLAERFPQHRWIGHQHGYYAPRDEERTLDSIRATQPDLLLVAMGNPLQEEWIARCADRTGAVVCLGVGALFDFIAERVPRAPLWVRRMGCEWVFRLIQEPGRMWRRYLIGNVTFLWAARGDKI